MRVEKIDMDHGSALGLSFQMQKAPLIVIRAENGFLMCGYLDMASADALGDAAAKIRGVATFEDALKAPVIETSRKAERLGVTVGMSGKEALELMC